MKQEQRLQKKQRNKKFFNEAFVCTFLFASLLNEAQLAYGTNRKTAVIVLGTKNEAHAHLKKRNIVVAKV